MASLKITFLPFWKKGESYVYTLLTLSGKEGVWAAKKKKKVDS
jgi:hypothetical protein